MKKSRRRTSPIWTMDLIQFKQIISVCHTFTEVLAYFGLKNKGGNNRTLKERLLHEDINYQHLIEGNLKATRNCDIANKRPDNEVFIENGPSRNCVRKRLIKDKLIPYICDVCKQEPFWNGQPLTLVLDHINGISNDHRLENLRFLCPNCNSQTDTFCGKNKKYCVVA